MRRLSVAVGVLLAIGVAGGVFALGSGDFPGRYLHSAGPSAIDGDRSTPAPGAPAPTGTPAGLDDTATPSPTATATATPRPRDPDRDNLPTRYEESIGTDPMHKTVLLAVNYTGNVTPLSDGDRSFLQAKFDQLKVLNPDGTTGIDLRVVEEWNSTAEVAVDPTTLRRSAKRYHAGETPADRCRHHYLLVGAAAGHRWGVANTGGWTAIVKSDTTGFSGSREDVIVHELLHTLVGQMDPTRGGVRSDGTHTTSGWLQPYAEMGGPSSLHPVARERLNERGFTNAFAPIPGCL
jgi:hypothetical protein